MPTVREMVEDIQVDLRDGDVPPKVARGHLNRLTAMIGNCNKEIRIAQVEYNLKLLVCLSEEKHANKAQDPRADVAGVHPVQEAKDTKELVVADESEPEIPAPQPRGRNETVPMKAWASLVEWIVHGDHMTDPRTADDEITDYDITTAMHHLGGTFVAKLAAAWMVADPQNRDKLKAAFPDYWDDFREVIKLRRERQQVNK